MPWPAMKATMSSLSEIRLSGCIGYLLSQKPVCTAQGISTGNQRSSFRVRGTGKVAKFEHHLFLCTNERDEGAARPSCGKSGSTKLKRAFKEAIQEAGLKGKVRANEAGCLDQCEHGPTVVVYPEAVWYGRVTPEDVDEIVTEHLVHGRPVERLVLADECLNTASCPHRAAVGAKS